MTQLRVKTVLNAIKCEYLDLANNGDGYWYFIYDRLDLNFFETHSVYTMRLNDMPLDRWVGIAKEFIAACEKQIAERN